MFDVHPKLFLFSILISEILLPALNFVRVQKMYTNTSLSSTLVNSIQLGKIKSVYVVKFILG